MYIGRNRNLTSYEHLNYPHTKLYEIVDIDLSKSFPCMRIKLDCMMHIVFVGHVILQLLLVLPY